LGTGIATALAVNTGSAGAPVLFNGALGTPSSGTLTNATGLPNAGLVNSSITIGGTAIALGASSNALANDITVYGVTVGRGAAGNATNTAVGFSALSANTTGAYNTVLGYQAGLGNTTGNLNTAMGYQAMADGGTITGTENVGIGYISLGKLTSGFNNVGVGNYTLRRNTTGATNTAIGTDALQANTTASNNTAVGYQAGYGTTTAQYSVFVGSRQGTVGDGDGNTVIGDFAGNARTSGTYNTFLGQSAGYLMTTGSKNVITGGYGGNSDGLDIRTASNYVVISDGDGNRQITMKEGQTLALDSAVPNSGTGITFPATQSASSDANTLDDYEEGTWTPAMVGATFTTTSSGTYVKIGQVVTVWAYITATYSAATGSFRINNLPFTVFNNADVRGGVGNVMCQSGVTFTNYVTLEPIHNNTNAFFEDNKSNANRVDMDSSNFASGFVIRITCTYRTSA
jgi:hypothetical protein